MMGFLKTIGYGVLYTLLLPFILLLLAVYAIYCLVLALYEAIRTLVIFFSGGTPFGDLKEDVKAKEILIAKQNSELNPAPAPQSQNIFIIQGANVSQGSVDANGNVITNYTPNQNQIPNNAIDSLLENKTQAIDYKDDSTGGTNDD